jgi:hypothetical protein
MTVQPGKHMGMEVTIVEIVQTLGGEATVPPPTA